MCRDVRACERWEIISYIIQHMQYRDDVRIIQVSD